MSQRATVCCPSRCLVPYLSDLGWSSHLRIAGWTSGYSLAARRETRYSTAHTERSTPVAVARPRRMHDIRTFGKLLALRRATRVLNSVFLIGFVLYGGAAIIFLSSGFAPFLAKAVPSVGVVVRELADD